MAEFSISGISELNELTSRLSDVPNDVINDVLTAMGETTAKYQKQTGNAKRIYDPNWNGKHVLESFKVNKPKRKNDIPSITVTFNGTRTRGTQTIRNAEIAFLNEYGVPGKNIPPKPFVLEANKLHEDEIYAAGEKVWHDYLDSLD